MITKSLMPESHSVGAQAGTKARHLNEIYNTEYKITTSMMAVVVKERLRA